MQTDGGYGPGRPLRYDILGFDEADTEEIISIINDPRGWVGWSYEFVHDAEAPDVHIMKKTPEEIAERFPTRLHGLSVASRSTYPATIWVNAKNWHYIPKDFVGTRAQYRAYLIQHEMGHILGYGHVMYHENELCPVMYQQSLGTRGKCTSNPWITKL